jgi:hypothetical protein
MPLAADLDVQEGIGHQQRDLVAHHRVARGVAVDHHVRHRAGHVVTDRRVQRGDSTSIAALAAGSDTT